MQGSALGSTVQAQVRKGEPRPGVRLADWIAAVRDGTTPPDSYVFQNVSGGPVARDALGPLHDLWRDVAHVQFELHGRKPRWPAGGPPALIRLGLGGPGSGAPFNDHDVVALNVAFEGHKRWLITRPCSPDCRIPFFEGGAAVYHPAKLFSRGELPAAALQMLGAGGETWDCVQRPGEVVLVPKGFLHATINLDQSVAVAVQCDDGADVRSEFSELNALVVHANGAAKELGPCGVPWKSPFGDLGAEQALEMLNSLPSNFRGDPGVFLNRRMPDGHNPIDVAVRYGGVDVASALVSHGARFMPTHLAEAQRRGHSELAALIDALLTSQ